jgi:pimeloyl-ACP methyl ester carboxylesterase
VTKGVVIQASIPTTEANIPTTAELQTLQVSEYAIFYEFVDGSLLRRMQPIELSYFRRGTGDTTLICLHSLSGASRTFAGLADALDGELELVALDLRGFGRSHRPTQDYSVEIWVEDVLKLVAALGGGFPPVVYGHGLGACIALALAARLDLGGVAVSGVALSPGEPEALGQVIASGDRGEPVTGILEALTGAPAAVDDLTPQIVGRAARAWQSLDGRSLADPGIPLLVLAAEDDALAPPGADGGAVVLAGANGAPLVRLPGGHELPATQPKALAAALLDWVNDRKR